MRTGSSISLCARGWHLVEHEFVRGSGPGVPAPAFGVWAGPQAVCCGELCPSFAPEDLLRGGVVFRIGRRWAREDLHVRKERRTKVSTASAEAPGVAKELPPDFDDLAVWTAWALDTEAARNQHRLKASYGELERLYGVLHTRIDSMLEYLDRLSSEELAEPMNKNLLNLALVLAEVAPAIEFYKQPQVADGFSSDRFAIRQ